MSKTTIAVVSLGCDKNRVDTENMLYTLTNAGYALTTAHDKAHVIIVNTCAFIESARREAVETILEMAEYKKSGSLKKLIVTGCLPQKYADEIKSQLPEVDAFLGVKAYTHIADIIQSLSADAQAAQTVQTACVDTAENENRFLTTPQHYAYLRIADGCDNRCAYCTIPSIRGAYTSRTPDSLVREALNLTQAGARELILIAQDVTRYGKDLGGGAGLIPLLQRLSAETPVQQIRLMYCYPELVTDELIHEIAHNPIVAKYIDIPFQHTHDRILRLMNRRCTEKTLREIMQKIRAQKTYIAVRTTLMTGFPSETEEEFMHLCGFVKEMRPDHVGVFTYSKEPDTPAASMRPQVPEKTKLARKEKLCQIVLDNYRLLNASLVGKTLPVVYEGIDYTRGMFYGRTPYNAPEIDTLVYFSGEFADVGNVYPVKITGYDQYDLLGEINQHELAQ
ncbi:MAG: 30S ribosomal protein S12 methylthiotransferase RimO [Firmicutes bacterium]|nr:30S ribosomal protein S12 methylthiotransferase RimO [Bacillota bacterium]